MPSRIPSYLRTYRRRSGLTQAEVAFLLGLGSGSAVSRYERLLRRPGLRTLLMLECIFGAPAREIVPAAAEEARTAVTPRARLLRERIAAAGARRRRALASLEGILSRNGQGPS